MAFSVPTAHVLRALCLLFLVRHLEFIYIVVCVVGECHHEVFDDFKDGLLTDGFRRS